MGNFVGAMVSEVLADGLIDRVFEVGAFAFDCDEWNAVYKENDVGATGLGAVEAFDFKFVGDVIDVVVGILPVDVVELMAFFIAVDGLFETFAEGEEIVEGFAGGVEGVVGMLGDRLDGFLDVGVAEGSCFVANFDRV